MEGLASITAYFRHLWPALLIGLLLFILVRPSAAARTIIYIGFFVLLRDALTPLGLWSFGSKGGFWLRFELDHFFLLGYGGMALAAMLLLLGFDRENRRWFRWYSNDRFVGVVIGFLSALLIAAPLLLWYQRVDISLRGGPVAPIFIPSLLLFSLLGNFLEEGLFRGFLLSHLKEYLPSLQAGLASGVVFAFCHFFLALTVTDLGLPLILFVLWEGLLAGMVGARYGVIPATIAHGGAIFLLASGLV